MSSITTPPIILSRVLRLAPAPEHSIYMGGPHHYVDEWEGVIERGEETFNLTLAVRRWLFDHNIIHMTDLAKAEGHRSAFYVQFKTDADMLVFKMRWCGQ